MGRGHVRAPRQSLSERGVRAKSLRKKTSPEETPSPTGTAHRRMSRDKISQIVAERTQTTFNILIAPIL